LNHRARFSDRIAVLKVVIDPEATHTDPNHGNRCSDPIDVKLRWRLPDFTNGPLSNLADLHLGLLRIDFSECWCRQRFWSCRFDGSLRWRCGFDNPDFLERGKLAHFREAL
jgi:hypothetical protein